MPIAHVHSPIESLILPYGAQMSLGDMLCGFQDRQACVEVCAPESLQDVTPSCWPATAEGGRYLLQVNENGEKAVLTQVLDPGKDLVVATNLLSTGGIAHSKHGIEQVISNSGCVEISYAPITPLPVRHIGGLILHVDQDSMTFLSKELFPPHE